MLYALILLPLIGAAVTWLIPYDRLRPKILSLFALAHLGITIQLLTFTPPPSPGGWFHLDGLGKIVLLTISILFLFCAIYSTGYLFYRRERSNRVLCVVLALIGLYFLAYATIVARVEPSLLLDDLIRDAGHLSSGWVHAAFVFLLVGFGTKMGLAPLHT